MLEQKVPQASTSETHLPLTLHVSTLWQERILSAVSEQILTIQTGLKVSNPLCLARAQVRSAKTDPVQFKRGFKEGRLRDEFGHFLRQFSLSKPHA